MINRKDIALYLKVGVVVRFKVNKYLRHDCQSDTAEYAESTHYGTVIRLQEWERDGVNQLLGVSVVYHLPGELLPETAHVSLKDITHILAELI